MGPPGARRPAESLTTASDLTYRSAARLESEAPPELRRQPPPPTTSGSFQAAAGADGKAPGSWRESLAAGSRGGLARSLRLLVNRPVPRGSCDRMEITISRRPSAVDFSRLFSIQTTLETCRNMGPFVCGDLLFKGFLEDRLRNDIGKSPHRFRIAERRCLRGSSSHSRHHPQPLLASQGVAIYGRFP